MRQPGQPLGCGQRLPLVVLLAVLGLSGTARADGGQSSGLSSKLLRQAERLRDEGLAALAAKDTQTASARFTASYVLAHEPRTLCMLARATQEAGRLLEAQDYARRCLADPTLDPADSEREAAQKLQQQPRPDSSELTVHGPPGSVLRIDGRFLGVLPLLLPVLVAPGEHQLVLEGEHKPVRSPILLPSGRGVVVRIKPESNAAVVTIPSAVLVVPEYGDVPAEAVEAVEQALNAALSFNGLSRFDLDTALHKLPEGKPCLPDISCQRRLATLNEIEYLLNVRVTAPPGGKPGPWQLRAVLLDPEVGDPAAELPEDCSACSAATVGATVRHLLEQVLGQGRARMSSALSVTSEPTGAEVTLDSHASGRTPYKARVWTGRHELLVKRPGYEPAQRQVVVEGSQATEVQIALAPVVAPAPAPPPPVPPGSPPPQLLKRSPWALITGIGLLGAGAVLVGLGGYALAIKGTCVAAPMAPALACQTINDSLASGAALTAIGGAALVGGTVAIVVSRRGKSAVRTR